MKTLSQAQSNTLTTVAETTSSHAEQQCSLTKSGGKTLTIAQLSKRTSAENDQNLAQKLKSMLKSSMIWRKKTIFGEYGCEFIEYVEFDDIEPETKIKAQNVIDTYFTPLDKQEIVKEIARLQLIAPEKEKNPIDKKARTMIWCEELSQYPADIVFHALRRKYRWFPALAEVLEYCDNAVAFRKMLKNKIRCKWIDD